jgi:RNA polymerase sigma-70 factor (ECF subfamily)
MEPDTDLSGLKPADLDDEIVNQYAERLLRVAQQRLGDQLRAKVSPEDVVQSAFKSFYRRQDEFSFESDGADGIWSLLVVITVRKCCNWAEVFGAKKRSAQRERSMHADQDNERDRIEIAGKEPTPEEAVQLVELTEQLFALLDPRHQQIISLRMQGYELEEIAEQVQSSRRTIARVVAETKEKLRGLI